MQDPPSPHYSLSSQATLNRTPSHAPVHMVLHSAPQKMSMVQADHLRQTKWVLLLGITASCLRLLHRMVHNNTAMPLVAFMDELCTVLTDFPILIIFETQIRMKLLRFLQLLAKAFPVMISTRPNLILLFCELQFWFRKNRARLRTQPFYSFIDAG